MNARPLEDAEFDASRRFHLWSYTVSHSQLLLRSNPDDGHSTRIEVLFKNVAELNLPATMTSLSVRRLVDAQRPEGTSSTASQRVYELTFAEGRGLVVAGAAFISEDALDYSDPSAFSSSLRQ